MLGPVVLAEQLYLGVPEAHAEAFESLRVIGTLRPGTYRLRVGEVAGEELALFDEAGRLVQTGTFGSPIGEILGFLWSPARHAFAPGAVVEFSLVTVEEAARGLATRLGRGIGPRRV